MRALSKAGSSAFMISYITEDCIVSEEVFLYGF